MAKLKALKSFKLEHLYNSLCAVPLQENTPLLAVGTWAFFETLTAKVGREANTAFSNYLSKARLQQYGLGTGPQTKPLREAIVRIADYGNTTKHHDTAAAFNGDQLANDLETLKELIIKCADDALAKTKRT